MLTIQHVLGFSSLLQIVKVKEPSVGAHLGQPSAYVTFTNVADVTKMARNSDKTCNILIFLATPLLYPHKRTIARL